MCIRDSTEDEAIARIADSEIVLVNKLPVTERLLDACPSIRLICVQATGYNTAVSYTHLSPFRLTVRQS